MRIRNKKYRSTDKWSFWHNCYVATATQIKKKTSAILIYVHVHILWTYWEAKIKIPILLIFASLYRFNVY